MIRLAMLMVVLQLALSGLLLLNLLAQLPALLMRLQAAGPSPTLGEAAMALALPLLLGGSAAFAWRLLQADRPGWALSVLAAIWALGLMLVVWAALTARWN